MFVPLWISKLKQNELQLWSTMCYLFLRTAYVLRCISGFEGLFGSQKLAQIDQVRDTGRDDDACQALEPMWNALGQLGQWVPKIYGVME